jgi:hypothetical protein
MGRRYDLVKKRVTHFCDLKKKFIENRREN